SLKKMKVVTYAELISMTTNGSMPPGARLAGIMIGLKERRNSSGSKFAFVQLSVSSGIYEVTVFSEALVKSRKLLDEAVEFNTPLVVSVDVRLEESNSARLLVRSFTTLDSAVAGMIAGFRIYIGDGDAIAPLSGLLSREQGGHGIVDVIVPWRDREARVRLAASVKTDTAIQQAIKSIPGVNHVEELQIPA
ncbi:MAG: hypothetical protein OXC54_04455, partial [Rhodospirillaceae bacterium]|nr:hypothetical protein [Rhodospirillaceae bacterium]